MTVQTTLSTPSRQGNAYGEVRSGMVFVYAMFTLYGVACGALAGWFIWH